MLYINMSEKNFIFYSVNGTKMVVGKGESIDSALVPDVASTREFRPVPGAVAESVETKIALKESVSQLSDLRNELNALKKEVSILSATVKSMEKPKEVEAPKTAAKVEKTSKVEVEAAKTTTSRE